MLFYLKTELFILKEINIPVVKNDHNDSLAPLKILSF